MVFSNRIHTFFSNIKITISDHFKSFQINFVSKIGLGKKVWYLVIGYTPFFVTYKSQFQTILNHFCIQNKPRKKGVVFSNRIHTFFSNIKITISNHSKSFSIVFVSKIGLGKKVWYLVIGYTPFFLGLF